MWLTAAIIELFHTGKSIAAEFEIRPRQAYRYSPQQPLPPKDANAVYTRINDSWYFVVEDWN